MEFELNKIKYPITINYYESIKVLPQKFGVSLTRMFVDQDEANETMVSLTMDDEKTLALAWYYVEQTASGMDEDDFLKVMTGKDLERFRDAFWQAVVNFSGPLKKPLLEEIWKDFKKSLKSPELLNQISEQSSSNSDQEESK